MSTNYTVAPVSGTNLETGINDNLNNIKTDLERGLSRFGNDAFGSNAMQATLDMNSNRVINLQDATTDSEPMTKRQHNTVVSDITAVTTANLSSAVSALNAANNNDTTKTWKGAVRAATTANITLSAPQTIDGVAVIAGDRVLVKDQTAGADNGIYVVAAGTWTRSTDMNSSALAPTGATVHVAEGTVNANITYQLQTNTPITLGATALTFGNIATLAPSAVTNTQLAGSIAFSKMDANFRADAKVYGTLENVLIYTANATWTKPAGLRFIEVEVQAGGGAGGGTAATTLSNGSCGSGGSAGGYAYKKILASSLGATEAATVGAAGVGVAGGTGGTGGNSSFGAHCSTTGGQGGPSISAGTTAISGASPVVGTATGGNINISGQAGGRSGRHNINFLITGNGGDSTLGKGGVGGPIATNGNVLVGNVGAGYGAGGSGTGITQLVAAAAAGGNGSPGIVIVKEYF